MVHSPDAGHSLTVRTWVDSGGESAAGELSIQTAKGAAQREHAVWVASTDERVRGAISYNSATVPYNRNWEARTRDGDFFVRR